MAWQEFRRRKSQKLDVQRFEYTLEDNIFQLHYQLKNKTYQHGPYQSFYITDPKLRRISKASVRDRVLHQAVFRMLYPIFDKSFIFDSYSCRLNKGTHRAVNRLQRFFWQASQNNTKTSFCLKCDIKKFFDSVDQLILLKLIKEKVKDEKAIWLVEGIIRSFEAAPNKGLPLGNITSQLFANVYLNCLDQFIKHDLSVKHYIRYCDDFVILSAERSELENLISSIADFLKRNLRLSLHFGKIEIRKYHQGIDFLGYVCLPKCCFLRSKTQRRMLSRIKVKEAHLFSGKASKQSFQQTIYSYLGALQHCKSRQLQRCLINKLF